MGETLVKRGRGRCLVVDEKGPHERWLSLRFGTVDPENREIVCLQVTKYRESVDALAFLKRYLRYCKGKPIITTDGGP